MDDKTYYSSPSVVAADGRPWYESHTPANWGALFANPDMGVADFPVWQRFLEDVTVEVANDGKTDKLPDVKGAEHEYKLHCTPGSDVGCPPPFRTGRREHA
ncbi:hypothetical protein ACNAW0_27470 [Micromonospora sp. SL1-18]|uniref:hypothetical protein n=1 Tax=Micromonospora sp. SL1-18 TaxID=3399128 RepID=UPI003A4D3F25